MNYGQVRDFTLQLLNQYSVAGELVPSNYNCQQDYIARIPALVNDAVMEIATTAMKIPEVLDLSTITPEEYGDQLRYDLPEDFYQFRTGGALVDRDGKIRHTNFFSLQGRKYILIPKREKGNFTVEYYRYPRLLPETPSDSEELDNEPVTHTAVPYYVAAHLVIHDDAFKYSAFYNKYEDKLAKMSPGLEAEFTVVHDQYEDAFYGGDPECW